MKLNTAIASIGIASALSQAEILPSYAQQNNPSTSVEHFEGNWIKRIHAANKAKGPNAILAEQISPDVWSMMRNQKMHSEDEILEMQIKHLKTLRETKITMELEKDGLNPNDIFVQIKQVRDESYSGVGFNLEYYFYTKNLTQDLNGRAQFTRYYLNEKYSKVAKEIFGDSKYSVFASQNRSILPEDLKFKVNFEGFRLTDLNTDFIDYEKDDGGVPTFNNEPPIETN